MYGKLFTSLYQGTLRGCSDEILVFTNLIAHADAHGHVDKHYRAIAEETGISIDRVKTALANLEAPDLESRSPEEEGRRIVPLDEHRAWGWRIVNYPKYRSIRNEDDRREQNRLAQQRWRDKQKKADVSTVSHDKPISAQAEAEAEADTEEERKEVRGVAEAAPRPPRPRATATRIPDPFPITPEMWAWLAENEVRIENVQLAHDEWVEYWTNCTTAKAVKPRWDLAWQKGMKKAAQWEAERKANGTYRKNFNGAKPSGGELIANRPYYS